ncbi:MAG: DUF2214 family protein [Gammaproteobacteria bacterium]
MLKPGAMERGITVTDESGSHAIMLYTLFRYLHFLAIIGLVGALVIENMAIKRSITGEDARNLARVDAVLGISATAVLLFGVVLWLWVGKPPEFYSENPLFWAKLALFGVVFLLSVYPTVFFLRHRKGERDTIIVPVAVLRLIRAELILLPMIPLLAFLMARGIGLPA